MRLYPSATCRTISGLASAESIGQFAAHQDIGAVKRIGAAGYDDQLQQYRISASGKNTWFADDQMHYAYNQMQGDFIVTARIAFEGKGKGADPHRKIATPTTTRSTATSTCARCRSKAASRG